MKILYIITGLGQGGAERVVCDLADAMFEKGNEVKIAYLTGKVLTQPDHDEIDLIQINLNRALSLPKAYLKLSKIIREYQPDVVHSHMVHANLLTRLIRLVVPIETLICTAHSSNEGSILRKLVYRATHGLADLTTNVSKTAVAAFEKDKAVPKNGMKTIYNGVNFENFSYHQESKQALTYELQLNVNRKIILAVGRFNESKNYPNLLEAIRIFKDEYSIPFVLLIAGDGELRKDIEQTIINLKLSDDVILLGRRDDIPKLMSACDVFVLSSDYEGLPTVLIEAMACQAHIISTDVSGVREIVSDHGKVIPIKQPIILAKALKDTLNDSNGSKNILGAQYVKSKFDLNVISEEWLKIYNEN